MPAEVTSLTGAFLVVGTLWSFVLFGYAQEALTKTQYGDEQEKFTYTTFLVLLQSLGNSVVAAVLLLVSYGGNVSFTADVPIRQWLIVAIAYLGAHKLGLWSLLYIPFPLQVMVKSCKTIPVMLGEIVLAGARPGAQKILSVVIMTLGIGIFLILKPSKKNTDGETFELNGDTLSGMAMVAGALVCDGVYGPYQNKICDDCEKASGAKPSAYHLMFNMNFYQGLFALLMTAGQPLYAIATGAEGGQQNELLEVQGFIERHPEIMPMLVQFSLAMALGNIFIYQLQQQYGALVVTTTTTFRKFLSVLASSLPKDGICHFVPVLPDGACGLAVFPGCALFSCASLSGFDNVITPAQWVGVALVIGSKPVSSILCAVLGVGASKKKAD